MRKFNTRRITRVAVLAALSAILYFIPGIPIVGFYKLDFSAVGALMAALLGGPADALIVALIKDLTGLLHSSSGGIGEIADFLCCASLAIAAYYACKRPEGLLKCLIGAVCGTLAMAVVGAISNYCILLPFFGVDKAVGYISSIVPAVNSRFSLVLYVTVPFNLLKGAAVCAVGYPLYTAVRKALKLGFSENRKGSGV